MDFERIVREYHLQQLTNVPSVKAEMLSYYDGLDRGRWDGVRVFILYILLDFCIRLIV